MRAIVRRDAGEEAVDLRIEGIGFSQEGLSGARSGADPTPEELLAASVASCTATTMELYARRKGWHVGEIQVDVDYTPTQRGSPTRCAIVVKLAEDVPAEQRTRLMQVGVTSRMHRALEGEIVFDERLELAPAAGPPPAEEPPSRRRIALLNGVRAGRRSRSR